MTLPISAYYLSLSLKLHPLLLILQKEIIHYIDIDLLRTFADLGTNTYIRDQKNALPTDVNPSPDPAQGKGQSQSPYLKAVEIYKVADKHDLPRAVCVNSVDECYVSVASTFGLTELNLPHALK